MVPREQFARYYTQRYGSPASEAMLSLFDELMAKAGGA
jgi:hypothetical protein